MVITSLISGSFKKQSISISRHKDVQVLLHSSKIQKGFLKLANKNKKKYKVINSNLDINYNKNKIIQIIDGLL